MYFMAYNDLREHPRGLVKTEVDVNDGRPYQGGKLHDVSVGGAAVVYPYGSAPTSERICVGQDLTLIYLDNIVMPGKVARLFDGGFAVQFNFSLH